MALDRSSTSLPEKDPRERALAHTVGQPELMARVLLARGYDDPQRIKGLLDPDLSTLHDPFAFKQMAKAVDRIREAIGKDQKIMIHGDYDVDGITSTVLMMKLFALIGANAKPFIPKRGDGYSFTKASIDAIEEGDFKVCISVDNGTNACQQIEAIQARGCDVIVTDHHGTSDNVAKAFAVLNPRLPDAGYPDRDLAGVGVAFRLASAIARSFSRNRMLSEEFRQFLLDAMTLVALGTIADVAPLRGENRIMTFHGLRSLAVSRNPGIRALLDSAGIARRSPDAEDVAFRIAPLINAAGRMGSALEAVALLTADGYQQAQVHANALEKYNAARRKVEKQLLDQARTKALASKDRILVLAGDDWHPGVMGIVAARLAETLRKPTIVVSFENDRGRGSGRTPAGFHLRRALHACAEYLGSYGGHAGAAGFEIDRQNIDAFREKINSLADQMLVDRPPIDIDGVAELAELDPQALRRMEQIGPFGRGNPRPTFVSKDIKLVGYPTIDSWGRDLRFRVAKEGVVLPAKLRHGAAHFETVRALDHPVEIIYSPRLSRRGEEGPMELHIWQLRCKDMRKGSDDKELILP